MITNDTMVCIYTSLKASNHLLNMETDPNCITNFEN